MNTIAQQFSHVSTWWMNLSISPVEVCALVALAIAVVVAASTYRRTVPTLNERLVSDAGLTVEEARR